MIAAIPWADTNRTVVCACSRKPDVTLAHPLRALPVAVAVVGADLNTAIVPPELDGAGFTGRAVALARDRVARTMPAAVIGTCPRAAVRAAESFMTLAVPITAEAVTRTEVLERVGGATF